MWMVAFIFYDEDMMGAKGDVFVHFLFVMS